MEKVSGNEPDSLELEEYVSDEKGGRFEKDSAFHQQQTVSSEESIGKVLIEAKSDQKATLVGILQAKSRQLG